LKPLAVRRTDRPGGHPELALDVPSDVRLIADAVELIARQLDTGPLSPRRVQFNLRTALAEALANAMIYGNAQDPSKLVRIRVELAADRVRVFVTDTGTGFDHAAIPDPTDPEAMERDSGRGLFVIRHLVDRVEFNDRGNTICLTLRADSRLESLLDALGRVARARLRLWSAAVAGPVQAVAGTGPEWTPPLNGQADAPRVAREHTAPHGRVWLQPVPGAAAAWLEIAGGPEAAEEREALARVVGEWLAADRETTRVAAELSERYEEIDLIYTISEILGHTIRVEDAAQNILREVADVVGARRATLLVYDPDQKVLKVLAGLGVDTADFDPIEVDDPVSVAASAFRHGRTWSYDPRAPDTAADARRSGARGRYRGRAFLSVPVVYAAPGQAARPIGVINLTDRVGEDAFSPGDTKLVTAIANQIGAALENSRLVQSDLRQERVRQELELAHDLQLKLLPSPLVVAARADVAARCRPAESVGGDFYNLLRLRGDRIGVMIGDVSSHGFGAALIMAQAMAAAGIHAEAAESPTEALRRLDESLGDELQRTEMFVTAFYAVIDPAAGQIWCANAGHALAFLVDGDTGAVQRLGATRTPLGVPSATGVDERRPWRHRRDILCLFTDGVTDAIGTRGERFGEERTVAHVVRMRTRPAREILEAIFADLAAFTGGVPATDDRTVVVLRV
jgi:sigma-B regulation protein RsbU (phosphoserine phosphatase)